MSVLSKDNITTEIKPPDSSNVSEIIIENEEDEEKKKCCEDCVCDKHKIQDNNVTPEEVKRLLNEKEAQLRAEFVVDLEKEIELQKERFDFVLQTEQTRTAQMLREAYRERQEKIDALTKQLECKNLASIMYVLCTERRRSRLEAMRIIEEYTNIIKALQEILTEGQSIIINMSKGSKTAARVDEEWKKKMTKIVKEFQKFVDHYIGGAPESSRFYFDLPSMLKIESPLDNPHEDPWEELEEEMDENSTECSESDDGDQAWWEQIEKEWRPFVMFGDMADFTPDQRRAVLKVIKNPPVAPKKWKSYVFHEMFLKTDCPHNDLIKNEYEKHHPRPNNERIGDNRGYNFLNRRATAVSVDTHNMGSILKIIASSSMSAGVSQSLPIAPTNRSLLATRDSMEIMSTTKFREKRKRSNTQKILRIGSDINKPSKADEEMLHSDDDYEVFVPEAFRPTVANANTNVHASTSTLGEISAEDLQPVANDTINYEKVCPMKECQRMQTSSFIRSLPPYMRENPYSNFQRTFNNYDPCTPEQIEILRQRLEQKKNKEPVVQEEDPLKEWTVETPGGVEVQTSLDLLPDCTCGGSASSDDGVVFSRSELITQKIGLDQIAEELLFDDRINFDRFKVVGQGTDEKKKPEQKILSADFKRKRMNEINKILAKHPSLCEIFQAARS